MITYLINFTLCSASLLLTYHLLLKNKTMYGFNRFFLLFSLVLSLTTPLISIKKDAAPLPSIQAVEPVFFAVPDKIISNDQSLHAPVESSINYASYIPVAIYGLVAFLLLLRFAWNLSSIRRMVINNKRVKYQGSRLVLIDELLTPHTFLNFIFINGKAYTSGQVEKEVLQHEMAHARQLHSLDIIFIELLQALCWCNPFIFLYRKAIQLNHEFIADEAVLTASKNIVNYQTLLLGKAAQLQSLSITSQFNYSITKKRLIMMTKTTSATTAWLSRLAIVPVMTAAFMLFCVHTEAQQVTDSAKKNGQTKATGTGKLSRMTAYVKTGNFYYGRPYPSTKGGITDDQRKIYIGYEQKYAARRLDFSKTITRPEEDMLEKLFQQMTPEQQKNRAISFEYPPEPLKGSHASLHEFETWKDPKVWGVWVDGKRVKNSELKNYDANKFVMINFSRLTDLAVKNDGFHYQIELMTKPYYENYREQAIANQNNSIIVFHLKA